MRLRRQPIAAALLLSALIGAGCASNPLTLPPLTSALGAVSLPMSPSADPPVEVYARVAKGALKCWFGPEGSLKKTHVFHAKVDPPSAGGAAEIAVHTRDADTSRGVLKAFGIAITPGAAGSIVEAQNVRFPEPLAANMTADVARWVAGQEGCSIVCTGGRDAAAPAAGEPATKATVTAKAEDKAKPKDKAAPKR